MELGEKNNTVTKNEIIDEDDVEQGQEEQEIQVAPIWAVKFLSIDLVVLIIDKTIFNGLVIKLRAWVRHQG